MSNSSSVASLTSTPTSTITSIASIGDTIPIATTIVASSSICVVDLKGQVLDDGSTALVQNLKGNYVTLNQSCVPETRSLSEGRTTVLSIVTATPSADHQNTNNHHDGLSSGAIAGICLAVIFGISFCCGVGILLWWLRRRRLRRRRDATGTSPKSSESASEEISPYYEKDGGQISEKDGGQVSEMPEDRAAREVGDGLPHELESPTVEQNCDALWRVLESPTAEHGCDGVQRVQDSPMVSHTFEGSDADTDIELYCYCNKPESGRMIACDGRNCERRWFHFSCLALRNVPPAEDRWFCPDCRD